MKDSNKDEIQKVIKEYIDSISEYTIGKFHIEDMELTYKLFSDKFFSTVKLYCKENKELNIKVSLMTKDKKKKEETKLQFFLDRSMKLTEIIKMYPELSDNKRLIAELDGEIQMLKSREKYEIWLDWALKNSRRIQLATHVAKLTHSSSQSSSIDYRFYANTTNGGGHLATGVNGKILMDFAYPDNKYSSIGKFYNLVACKSYIGDLLRDDGTQFLEIFTKSESKASSWATGFRANIRDKKKSSSFLSKQVYFPISDEKYHLLMPLISSSMAHELFTQFERRFDQDYKKNKKVNDVIWDQKKKNKYHSNLAVLYPNRAVLNVTGSNHSNASSLNGKRGGKLALLTNRPPKLKNRKLFSLSQNNLFNRELKFKLIYEIKALQRLLLAIKDKEISINKPTMHNVIIKNIIEIANGLFDEVTQINLQNKEKGWTQKSALPVYQQLLIEPYREDENAIQAKNNNQWQLEIAEDFSYWLNKQLKHKKLTLTPIQQALWRDIFKQPLREFIAIQESE